jgi:hypothetical protein
MTATLIAATASKILKKIKAAGFIYNDTQGLDWPKRKVFFASLSDKK